MNRAGAGAARVVLFVGCIGGRGQPCCGPAESTCIFDALFREERNQGRLDRAFPAPGRAASAMSRRIS